MAAVWTALNGCNGSSSTTTSASDSSKTSMSDGQSKEERNKQIVRASMDAMSKYDVDEGLKTTAAGVVDYGDGSHPPIKGLDSVKSMIKQWMGSSKAAFPDMKASNIVLAASGDTVLAWSEYSGAWKGAFMGQKPNGKSFRMYGVDYFILNDEGKIISHRTTPGDAEMAKQIGIKM